MKKLFVLMILIGAISTTTYAENINMSNTSQEYSLHNRRNNRHNRTSIPKDKLPANITNYLNKNYPGHAVILSKLKGDGYYYVKIKYNENRYRSFYRDLVFDRSGNPVRG